MSTAFDPQTKDDKSDLPVREGQGQESSIRANNEQEKSGDSEAYPFPDKEDKRHKAQDEYDNKAQEKKNKTV